jgi:gluconate:H+ symporter, GntP family
MQTTIRPEFLTIATGAGSLIFSRLNVGGFCNRQRILGMSVAQTLKSWSICETIIPGSFLWKRCS